MADIKMRRNGTKIFIEAASKNGAAWLLDNMVRPQAINLVVEYEYGKDLEEEFKKAGLEVEGP